MAKTKKNAVVTSVAEGVIKDFFRTEVDYTTMTEEAILAQTALLSLAGSQKDATVYVDDLTEFMFHATSLLMALRPFATDTDK